MQKYIFLILLANLLIWACVEQPTKPDENGNPNGNVIILSEGLLGKSNSYLSIVNTNTNQVLLNYFETQNIGLKLGDTANGMIKFGDTLFIAVTGSETIEAVDIKNGKSLGRIHIPGSSPRKLTIVNDTTAYASDLYNHQLIKFNPKTIKFKELIKGLTFYPEAIEYYKGKLFVANSGLGVFFKKNPMAGTLSIIDEQNSALIKTIDVGKNFAEIIINEKNASLILCYYNTYEKDSLGGIVEIDLETFKEKKRIKGHFRSITLSKNENILYAINQVPPKTSGTAIEGIIAINLNNENIEAKSILKNDKKGEFWYSLSIDEQKNEIWIGNAKNFQIEGEIIVYNLLKKSIINRYIAGINPNTIIFIKK